MRILLSLLFASLLMLSFVPQGITAQGRDGSPDIKRIMSKGKITVALVNRDRYPFYMTTKGGQLTGFDIDLARDIASRLGVRVEFNRNAKTFDEVIDIVAKKEADLGISNLTVTLKRAKQVHFTRPYLAVKNYLLVNRKGLGSHRGLSVGEMANRRGIKILAEEGSSYAEFSSRIFPLAKIVSHKDRERAIQAVLKNEAFALYESEDFIKTLFKNTPELYLYLDYLVIDGVKDTIAIAVHWENLHLLSWLDLYLKTVWSDATIDDILKKYPK
ncbi:MAG: ABC transporter substrate-binding protein [Deltaproteobacteria bacterium]